MKNTIFRIIGIMIVYTIIIIYFDLTKSEMVVILLMTSLLITVNILSFEKELVKKEK